MAEIREVLSKKIVITTQKEISPTDLDMIQKMLETGNLAWATAYIRAAYHTSSTEAVDFCRKLKEKMGNPE